MNGILLSCLPMTITITITITTNITLSCNRCWPRDTDMLNLGCSSFSCLMKHPLKHYNLSKLFHAQDSKRSNIANSTLAQSFANASIRIVLCKSINSNRPSQKCQLLIMNGILLSHLPIISITTSLTLSCNRCYQ